MESIGLGRQGGGGGGSGGASTGQGYYFRDLGIICVGFSVRVLSVEFITKNQYSVRDAMLNSRATSSLLSLSEASSSTDPLSSEDIGLGCGVCLPLIFPQCSKKVSFPVGLALSSGSVLHLMAPLFRQLHIGIVSFALMRRHR